MKNALLIASLATLAVGCSPMTMSVVDLDNNNAPIAGATVSRFQTPHHAGDPYPTTPNEVKQTDAEGKVVFKADNGRFLVSAPGKADVAFTSLFPPRRYEIGVSAGPTTGK